MLFENYMYSLPNGERLVLLNALAKYGDPNDVLNHLFAMPICFADKDTELRVDARYVLCFRPIKRSNRANIFLLKMEQIAHAYLSLSNSSNNVLGFARKEQGRRLEIPILKGQDALRVFQYVSAYVTPFRQIQPYGPQERTQVYRDKVPYRTNGEYILQNDFLREQYRGLIGGTKEKLLIPNINDIIWCNQTCYCDSEGPDSYYLELYLLNQKTSYNLMMTSEYQGFLLAVELKKRVPHLLYGHNEQYMQIYRRNPAELMALAKSQCRR